MSDHWACLQDDELHGWRACWMIYNLTYDQLVEVTFDKEIKLPTHGLISRHRARTESLIGSISSYSSGRLFFLPHPSIHLDLQLDVRLHEIKDIKPLNGDRGIIINALRLLKSESILDVELGYIPLFKKILLALLADPNHHDVMTLIAYVDSAK